MFLLPNKHFALSEVRNIHTTIGNSIVQKFPRFLFGPDRVWRDCAGLRRCAKRRSEIPDEKQSSFIDVVGARFPEYRQTAPSCNTRSYPHSVFFHFPFDISSCRCENRSARNSTDNWRYCTWTSGAQTEYYSNTYSRSWYLPTCILQERRIDSIDIHGPSRGNQMWGYSLEPLPFLPFPPPLHSSLFHPPLHRFDSLPRRPRFEGRSGKAGNNWPQTIFLVCLRVSPRGNNFPRVANSRLSAIDVCFFYHEHLELSDWVRRRLLCRVFFFRVYFPFYISLKYLKKYYFERTKLVHIYIHISRRSVFTRSFSWLYRGLFY